MKFTDIALNNQLQKALNTLEYNQATEIQQQAIPLILADNDVMARAKTGTGKTAGFTLPLLQRLSSNSSNGKRNLNKMGCGYEVRFLVE